MRAAIKNELIVDSHGAELNHIKPWSPASSEDSVNLAKPVLFNVLEVSFESPLSFSIAKAEAPAPRKTPRMKRDGRGWSVCD